MLRNIRLLVYLLACCLPVAAQLANTTSLVGNVIDTAGAPVPDATITAVNTATGDTYTAKTGADGSYHVEFLKIGTYSITVKHEGFSTMTTSGVLVDMNQTVRTDFSLKVGQVTERVEVVASNPPIATDEASIKEVISSQAIAELPLNGRDALQLALTAPGVFQGQKGANGTPPGEDFIGAGTREIQNSISLDGISIVNNLITTAPFHPSVDAVQELEVQSGTYSAQYGAYMGVHLNVVTKSGTNQIHGAVYEFLRNSDLDARNFFLSPTAKKTPLHQNQFGFEVDLPVIIPKIYNGKNKTFVMMNYEGRPHRVAACRHRQRSDAGDEKRRFFGLFEGAHGSAQPGSSDRKAHAVSWKPDPDHPSVAASGRAAAIHAFAERARNQQRHHEQPGDQLPQQR